MDAIPYDQWWFWVVFAPIFIGVALFAVVNIGALFMFPKTGLYMLSNLVVEVALGLLILWGSYSLIENEVVATVVAWFVLGAVTYKYGEHVSSIYDEARGR